ncbi:MAG: tyrosine-type recombinase/integrase [Lachnospiraceae bacterium]|nr:tyrosine-type recombinase/integrase [Lachnospiraceae bacterium]
MKTGSENIRRRTDGRWEARIVIGSPKNGKTNYKYLYGKTYEEVLDRKRQFLSEEGIRGALLRQTVSVSPSARRPVRALGERASANPEAEENQIEDETLFRYAAKEWLRYKESAVRESTHAYYSFVVTNQLLPVLGGIALTEITSDIISEFLNEKKAHGRKEDGSALAPKTVADMKVILKQILNYAKEKGMIEAVPACPAVPVRQGTIRVLTRQEQRLVEQAALALDKPFALGILLSLYGGLRIGEVCALKWGDFDFRNGTIRINKTAARIQNLENGKVVGTRLVIGKPKTDCSQRTVPLPETVLQYFKERRAEDTAYVLTGTEKLMEPRSCLARFKRFLKRCGVEDHTWHSLRHTFATRCVESGVDIKSLSEIMGHADVEITMQRYVHPSMDTKKEQVNKLPCFARE